MTIDIQNMFYPESSSQSFNAKTSKTYFFFFADTPTQVVKETPTFLGLYLDLVSQLYE